MNSLGVVVQNLTVFGVMKFKLNGMEILSRDQEFNFPVSE